MNGLSESLWLVTLSNLAGMLTGVLVCYLMGWRPPKAP